MEIIKIESSIEVYEIALLMYYAFHPEKIKIQKENQDYLDRYFDCFMNEYDVLLEDAQKIIEKNEGIFLLQSMFNHQTILKIAYHLNILEGQTLSFNLFQQAVIKALILNAFDGELSQVKDLDTLVHTYLDEAALDYSKTIDLVNSLDWSQEKKYQVLINLHELKSIYIELISVYEDLLILYRNFVSRYDFLLNAWKKLELTSFPLKDYLDFESFKELGLKEVVAMPSFVLFNGVQGKIGISENSLSLVFYGVFYDELKIRSQMEDNYQEKFKQTILSLGDQKRLDIIFYLFKKEAYAKELADYIGVSSSTLSHHMDILMASGLLTMRQKGKRIYYSINPKSIQEILVYLNKMYESLGG